MSEEKTPRETNEEIAHKAAVNAKYALAALAADRTMSEDEAQVYAGLTADAEKLVERIHAMRHPREAKRWAFSMVVEAADADEAFEFMAAEVTNTWHTDPEAVFLSNPRPIRNIDDYDGDEVARAVIEGEPDV